MKITNAIHYVGVTDRAIDLFEGQYKVKDGMTYNSYVIIDEKVAVFDTVDVRFTHEWLDNLREALGTRKPDYLIVQHMEPDHSAGIAAFAAAYPDAMILASEKAVPMIAAFFEKLNVLERVGAVANGASLPLGTHTLHFVYAPMVHWPEVMVTYESSERVLFSADAFGKFGAMKNDVYGTGEEWTDEARRYYIGIVGKYGAQAQALLKKAAELDIAMICPLHGPVLKDDLGKYISLYDTWSSYAVETDGIMIAYTSVYGNTKKAVTLLADMLKKKGCPTVAVYDLARSDMSEAVSAAFRYGKLVLASTTYNAGVFPFMRDFLHHLTERGFRARTVGTIENGTWAPLAARVMRASLEGSKDIAWLENNVTVRSAVNADTVKALEAMADELCRDYIAQSSDMADKNDLTALMRIGYGLYVVTSNDGERDNGLIVNTVTQVTSTPNRVAVTINKENYSHHVIKKTGKMNVCTLTVEAPFRVFEAFGFRSGRNVNKFENCDPLRSDNGLVFLPKYINSFMSLSVEQYVDLGTHGMFICAITEARVMSDKETMTYAYYGANVKPKPDTEGKRGFVCKICGYVYEGDTLPDDFICPLCKHGASDFEPISN